MLLGSFCMCPCVSFLHGSVSLWDCLAFGDTNWCAPVSAAPLAIHLCTQVHVYTCVRCVTLVTAGSAGFGFQPQQGFLAEPLGT